MGPLEPDSDFDPPVGPSRARRALTVMFVSVVAIAAIGIAYVRPPSGTQGAPVTPALPATYQLAGVDFVDATTGWFVASFDSGRFALLHTGDAGRTWTRQLTGETNQRGVYMRFFDATSGVFSLVGNQPLIFLTSDGGRTWSSRATIGNTSAYVQSVSFTNAQEGWVLVRSTINPGEVELLRTADGGTTWVNLGSPVAAGDQPYRVQFNDAAVGWLDTVSVKPHAYRSTDGGVSWTQVSLPAPTGGWPATGQFFVAAQPTQGAGVVATVVNFVPYVGRSGIGEQVIAFPPLTVRAFDGGLPVVYRYATFVDAIPGSDLRTIETENKSGQYAQGQAPNQVQLGSLDGGLTWKVIAPPAGAGAIGYSDAQTWWWIGSGEWSRSSDGGATWTASRNIGVIQPLPGSLTVLDSKHAWYGAMAGTRAVLERTADGGITWEMIGLPEIRP
jgi:photosystem II stability/assembly factor-like uncharacterized protein